MEERKGRRKRGGGKEELRYDKERGKRGGKGRRKEDGRGKIGEREEKGKKDS